MLMNIILLPTGQVGNWKTHLNTTEVEAFTEWEHSHLKDSDLSFMFTLPNNQKESEVIDNLG